ncbi:MULTISPECIES: hypothetical protein [unclassified Leifsonia]|uniref:hypothetical protein n=1 Tax=unclassified Leifsonia TaxID=2663824 RepID=UPI0006FB0E69|nr:MULTISPECIES: hypothetical protein [unclassified Leifsonia]KQX07739.1 hypothetical protein ASC59_08405 [Leifsonia sp. Root1293]KRA12021.1 hypothetical protein ASD61_08405 [Leifsonia sp. Root60]
MYTVDWFTIPYIAFLVLMTLGTITLLVLLGRLMFVATQALQSYRRGQEIKISLLLNEDERPGN